MSFACRPNRSGSGLNLEFSTTLVDSQVSPTDATARITFNTAGTCTFLPSGSGGWHNTAPAPTGWSIRRTVNSGALTTDAGAGWLALSSNRSFGCTETAIGTRLANVTFEFSSDGGASVAGSRTVAFDATVDP